jgi:hypothetical protein
LSFDKDKQTDIKSCFNTDKNSVSNTNLTNNNTNTKEDNKADLLWLYKKDKDYPPKYYIKQQNDFNKSEFANKDYSANSTNLLNKIKEE